MKKEKKDIKRNPKPDSEKLKQLFVKDIREEWNHAVEIVEHSRSPMALGHAQCASLLLDKWEGPDPKRYEKLAEWFKSALKEEGGSYGTNA